MFSVTYTGMNFFPLCTAIVCPTISGMTVERRDQVLMTFLSPPRFMTSIFSTSGMSTNGPFFSDLDILVPASAAGLKTRPTAAYFERLWTMKRSVRFVLRVLYPLVGTPHGDTGCRPPEVLPSPPPSG